MKTKQAIFLVVLALAAVIFMACTKSSIPITGAAVGCGQQGQLCGSLAGGRACCAGINCVSGVCITPPSCPLTQVCLNTTHQFRLNTNCSTSTIRCPSGCNIVSGQCNPVVLGGCPSTTCINASYSVSTNASCFNTTIFCPLGCNLTAGRCNVACFNDSDCGNPSVVNLQYCDPTPPFSCQRNETHTCINPGASNASCAHNTVVVCKDCAFGCDATTGDCICQGTVC